MCIYPCTYIDREREREAHPEATAGVSAGVAEGEGGGGTEFLVNHQNRIVASQDIARLAASFDGSQVALMKRTVLWNNNKNKKKKKK